MKIVAISDTHGRYFVEDIPECDVLILAGDILADFGFNDIQLQKQWFWDSFIPDLNLVPAKYKIFVAGNHDFYFYDLFKNGIEEEFRSKLPFNTFYLRDNYVILNKIKFYGTPWVTNLPYWAFNLTNQHDATKHYSKMDADIDVLISHGPPYGYGDTILEFNKVEHLGNKWLLEEIKNKRPKYVIFGHIHSGNHDKLKLNDINLYNVSILNESYNIHYKPLKLII